MGYKVGDKVRIKSLDWYNENKDEYGYIDCGSRSFFAKMSDWCGKIATIKEICKTNCYRLEEYDFDWTDDMIEGLVEEAILIKKVDNNGIPFNEWLSHKGAFHVPEDYVLKDENGNVINTTKIVLEKKKKEYPKTYEACEIILGLEDSIIEGCLGYEYKLLNAFQKLLMCRDAYWKIAGEEMGLGRPWEPDWNNDSQFKYIIICRRDNVNKDTYTAKNCILAFPTEEMRDAFKKNFDPDIEICKEFL